jgi:hypothetical protein
VSPVTTSRFRRPAAVLAAVAFTLVTVASCSSKTPSAVVPASSSPAATVAVATTATAAKTMAPATTAAPAVATTVSSGDAVIDAVGTDLAAFEKESDGLSNAAASTQEVTK